MLCLDYLQLTIFNYLNTGFYLCVHKSNAQLKAAEIERNQFVVPGFRKGPSTTVKVATRKDIPVQVLQLCDTQEVSPGSARADSHG